VLSEEEAVVGHAERWEAVVTVERKKSSLLRKVVAVVEGGSRHQHPVGVSLCTTPP
jgi:hypothetical protein